ncbi:thioesterase family protein [Longimicrobium sp.]|uniref:acyl-CoA thioesterase n=1 Tax=Longimicrobium sp. TaxID=2029185 RepID=UPI002E377712|nr:thioesterase family protein [Longimicrobium sp.]HEX6041009.1 thioesterase family protein [Longimicrobium sp.]
MTDANGAVEASEAERRLRAEFPVVVEWPVAWAEMDYFRHVNHARYFTYFESARIPYLSRIGFRELTETMQIGPILASTQARYRRPVVYPDTVVVGARATEVGDDRFTHEYRLVSRALGDVAAEGSALLVSYDYAAGRKTPLPAAVRAAIASLEASIGQG